MLYYSKTASSANRTGSLPSTKSLAKSLGQSQVQSLWLNLGSNAYLTQESGQHGWSRNSDVFLG